jgi:hypothetical protein
MPLALRGRVYGDGVSQTEYLPLLSQNLNDFGLSGTNIA